MSEKYILVKNPSVGNNYYRKEITKDEDGNDIVNYIKGVFTTEVVSESFVPYDKYKIGGFDIGIKEGNTGVYKLDESYKEPSCEEKFEECKKNSLQTPKNDGVLGGFRKSGGKMRSRKAKSKRRRILKKHKKTKTKTKTKSKSKR